MESILYKTIAIYRTNLRRFGDRNPDVFCYAENFLKDIEKSLNYEKVLRNENKPYTYDKVKSALIDYYKFGKENRIIDGRIRYPGPGNFKLLF